MNECYGKKFVLNGVAEPAEAFDNSLVYEGDSVYEVIRMTGGNPVFFKDHMDRLATSVRLQKKKMLADTEMLKKDIINLSRSEKRKEINLKVVFNYNKGENNYLVYFIEPIYPTDNQYNNGVKGILFYAERKDPESKVINHKLRTSIYHKLILEGAYEAILVNEKGIITEGSRSNIFFLKNDTLYTAPDSMVLSGITRKHILDICASNGIAVKMTGIKSAKLQDFDAVFMTGTSPMVLPFNKIDEVKFKVKVPVVEKLRKLYLSKAEDSIVNFRKGL